MKTNNCMQEVSNRPEIHLSVKFNVYYNSDDLYTSLYRIFPIDKYVCILYVFNNSTCYILFLCSINLRTFAA